MPDPAPPSAAWQLIAAIAGALGVGATALFGLLKDWLVARKHGEEHHEDVSLKRLDSLIKMQDGVIEKLREENEDMWKRQETLRSALDSVRGELRQAELEHDACKRRVTRLENILHNRGWLDSDDP